VATVPATRPLRGQDRMIVAGLLAALGRAPAYPAGSSLPGIPVLLERHGLRVVADDRRRFGYRLRGPGDADPFLDSLYLPGLSTRHYRLASAASSPSTKIVGRIAADLEPRTHEVR